MSNFSRDLHAESVLGEFLDAYFYQRFRFRKCKRIKDVDIQYIGIDVLIIDNQQYIIDEKGYLSKPTRQNTFALELSYVNKSGNRTEGWLFNPHKVTTHYLLCWADRDNVDLNGLTIDNIHLVEAILVNRVSLQNYLWNQYKLNRFSANEKVNQLVEQQIHNPIKLPHSSLYIKLSNQLCERPVNIIMSKQEYLHSGTVEAWFRIDRKGVERFKLPHNKLTDSMNINLKQRNR